MPIPCCSKEKEKDLKVLQDVLAFKESLLNIANQVYPARDLDEIFLRIQNDILSQFCADRITIYAVDKEKNELFSKYKIGDEIEEIRVKIDKKSIAGYIAVSKSFINITNVYNKEELKKIDPELCFNETFDIETGYRTRQVLACAILFKEELLGVIQLLNKREGDQFRLPEISLVKETAKILGVALHSQISRINKSLTEFDYLVQKELITEKELYDVVEKARKNKDAIVNILKKEYNIDKQDILESLSNFYNCFFIDFNPNIVIDKLLLNGLSPNYLAKNLWTPYKKNNGIIEVLVDDPNDRQKANEIKTYLNNFNIRFIGALPEDIRKYIDQISLAPKKEVVKLNDLISELDLEIKEKIEEEEDRIDESDNTIIKLANQIIRDAYNMEASDIHIEPYQGSRPTIVRYRIDGDCKKVLEIPGNYKRALISRIKIMSGLNIAERRLPQSGKIKFRHQRKDIELRVEVTPTVGGNENLVLRILASSKPMPLEKMNLYGYNLRHFMDIVSKPYGLVLVVGPTGSGKTTTLHSALGHINKPEKKIWTAEDPVEITQLGLCQVQVQSAIGLTFANCLRSFLRADPDVIMVGEMRDKETASIGIEASLTGHLVLSTLHTNSAPETIVRLLDMGIDAFNIANALLGILAQRLVKTLCNACKERYHPSKEEYEHLVHEYNEELFYKRLGTEYTENLMIYKPVGCIRCGNTGYKGRIGIHELLVATDDIKRLIIRGAEIEVIRDKAIEHGMTTLKQDGIMKVFRGYTDLTQVRKVCIK